MSKRASHARKRPLMATHFASGGDLEQSVGVVVAMRSTPRGLEFKGRF